MEKNSDCAKKIAVELWRRFPDSSSEDEDKKKEDKDKDEDDDTDKKKKKGKVGIIQGLFYIFFRCADVENLIRPFSVGLRTFFQMSWKILNLSLCRKMLPGFLGSFFYILNIIA